MALISDIQRFSLFDGPGIRTAVFFQGCPLDCIWCHNPESRSKNLALLYDARRCIGCGACIAACPNASHMMVDGTHCFDRSRCVSCGACAAVCPSGALRTAGREMTTEEIMAAIRADIPFYAGGGGVTLTGGEPLHSQEAAFALLAACGAEGIHTAVETCGHVPEESMMEAARHADLLLFDLKHPDETAHQQYTGCGNARILANLRAAAAAGARLWIRIPFIPGINSSREHTRGFMEILKGLPNIDRIEILPYHRMGASKCTLLGVPYRAEGIPVPGRDELDDFASALSLPGVPVYIM